jgi:hypothetical protein
MFMSLRGEICERRRGDEVERSGGVETADASPVS